MKDVGKVKNYKEFKRTKKDSAKAEDDCRQFLKKGRQKNKKKSFKKQRKILGGEKKALTECLKRVGKEVIYKNGKNLEKRLKKQKIAINKKESR